MTTAQDEGRTCDTCGTMDCAWQEKKTGNYSNRKACATAWTPKPKPQVAPVCIGPAALIDRVRELERELVGLKECLQEAMKYVESTDGMRGELYGSAVSWKTYREWARIAERADKESLRVGEE